MKIIKSLFLFVFKSIDYIIKHFKSFMFITIGLQVCFFAVYVAVNADNGNYDKIESIIKPMFDFYFALIFTGYFVNKYVQKTMPEHFDSQHIIGSLLHYWINIILIMFYAMVLMSGIKT